MELTKAVLNRDLEEVRKCLEKGSDPNERSDRYRYPICWASRYDDPDIVRELLQYGADRNATTTSERTPLMISMVTTAKSVFDVLIQEENKWEMRSDEGWTCFHYAAMNKDSYYLERLLEIKPKKWMVNLRYRPGKTPLSKSLSFNKIQQAKALIQYGVDLNSIDNYKKTALDYIIELENKELFDLVAERKHLLSEKDRKLLERKKLAMELR